MTPTTITAMVERRRDRSMDALATLDEGGRGSGAHRGELTVCAADDTFYPACSRHGAMNRIGADVWRCLATECNLGARGGIVR